MTTVERRGRNEAIFREVNERIADMSASSDVVEFLCECGERTCLTTFRVDIAVYRDVREHQHRFFVTHGHADPEIESVVVRRDDFVVVEKHGLAADVADHVRDAP